MDEAWAAARGNAGDVSRGGARQDSPEFGDFEAPGVGSRWGLAWERASGTRKPLGRSGEGIGTRDSVHGGDGGRTRRGIAGASSRGLWGALLT